MGDMVNTEPLLVGLESRVRLADYSSDAVEELLGQEKIPTGWWPRLVAWESRILWMLSGASIIVSIFNFMLNLATQMFTGHLGTLELAGASIACVGIQGLAYGIMAGPLDQLGMASAVQTLCGQAFGAKKYASLGIICQKAMILHLGAAVALSFLYWYSGAVLREIGQSDAIAKQGQIFARGLIPQLYAFALNCPMQRFLQAQNIVNPLAYIAVGVFVVHLVLTWLAVFVLDYGLLGAALTLSLSWWFLVALTALYIVYSPSCKETWTGFSSKAFKGLWTYSKLTASSAIMLCLEIWYSQGIVLISGLLPNPAISLDSFSICMNYLNWDMQFMLGLSAAASVRVGNELGACHPKVVKLSIMVVTGTSVLISLIFSAFVLIFRVAIGSGWQTMVAYVNLTTYYIIGLPIGCVLGFKTSLGVAGIWWGMIFGVLLQTLTLILLTIRTNWEKEVEKAVDRLKKSDDEETLSLVNDIA
ncbi:hypothetical protein GIB67_022218 [Kingdonia uniflora]|uniref:Protein DETOXIFICATION n=1 Tax=Kingdonia uniflora TaxID=39325 RepID=A0A7J7M6W7_9MAGN|nr:hypothetical protein GIB67_022218 [Kingdonia uniflora]